MNRNKGTSLALAIAQPEDSRQLGGIALLVAQGVVISFYSYSTDFTVDTLAYVSKALLIITLVYTGWQFVKALLVSHLKLPKIQLEFLKFKRNQKLFKTLLDQKPILFPDHIPDEHIIRFGVKNSSLKINGITNPMCGFCVDAFNVYKKLIVDHPEDVQINLIFSVPFTLSDNVSTQIATRMVEIYRLEGALQAWKAIDTWYLERNVEKWQAEFGVSDVIDSDLTSVLESHKEWCKLNEIDYTPATAIDNHLYPMEYGIADLPLLVGDLLLEKKLIKEDYELIDA